MSRIRSTNTEPEKLVRSFLHKQGFRFRLYSKKLPGKPDIILPKWKTVIFVNGCFWHQHPFCKRANIPKSNIEYWTKKLNRNVNRDKENYQKIRMLGWQVIIIWECEIKEKLVQLPDLIKHPAQT